MSSMNVASLIGLIRSKIHQQSTHNDGGGASTSSHGTGIPSHSVSSMALPTVSPSLPGRTAWFNSVCCFCSAHVTFVLAFCPLGGRPV